MNFYDKYQKYKQKYLCLTQKTCTQYGGNFLDTIYQQITHCIIDFNVYLLNDYSHRNCSEPNFVIIKGGACVNYYLTKSSYRYVNDITNDIDLLFIISNKEKNNVERYISLLYQYIQKYMQQYNTTINYNNGLYKIYVNNIHIIDITIYEPNEQYDTTSMVNYASMMLGFDSFSSFIDNFISRIQDACLFGDDIYVFSNENTFMPITFERHSVEKGIDNITQYIQQIPQWRKDYEQMIQYGERYKDIIVRLEKQLSMEYVNQLRDKLKRYQIKKNILSQL